MIFFHPVGSALQAYVAQTPLPRRKWGVKFSGGILGYYGIFITKYFRKTSEEGRSPWGLTIKKGVAPYPPPCPGMFVHRADARNSL